MNRRLAGFLFLGTCAILAFLLITHKIGALVSGFVFALALVVFGGLSRGFRR